GGKVRATVDHAIEASLSVVVPSSAGVGPITVTVDKLTGYSSEPFRTLFRTTGNIVSSSLGAHQDFNLLTSAVKIESADRNQDGRLDLIAAGAGAQGVFLLPNGGTGSS